MSVLIIKLGATGDVVRRTPLLRRLPGSVSWITPGTNLPLLQGIDREVYCVLWENRRRVTDATCDTVERVINAVMAQLDAAVANTR